jgi:hypothetical protein
MSLGARGHGAYIGVSALARISFPGRQAWRVWGLGAKAAPNGTFAGHCGVVVDDSISMGRGPSRNGHRHTLRTVNHRVKESTQHASL